MHKVPAPVGSDLHDRAMACFEDAADCITKARSFIQSIAEGYSHCSFTADERSRLIDMSENLALATKALRQ